MKSSLARRAVNNPRVPYANKIPIKLRSDTDCSNLRSSCARSTRSDVSLLQYCTVPAEPRQSCTDWTDWPTLQCTEPKPCTTDCAYAMSSILIETYIGTLREQCSWLLLVLHARWILCSSVCTESLSFRCHFSQEVSTLLPPTRLALVPQVAMSLGFLSR